jgi:hypothetical protein
MAKRVRKVGSNTSLPSGDAVSSSRSWPLSGSKLCRLLQMGGAGGVLPSVWI